MHAALPPAAPVRIVELVGPAGAGKSELAAALRARDGASMLTLWGLPRRLLAASAVSVVPTQVRSLLGGHPIGGSELAQMIRLGALVRVLDRRPTTPLVVLDEGPIFGLAWLEVFHRANGDRARREWRREALSQWARRLTAVIRVDAADTVLTDRIRSRAKPHPVKHDSDETIRGFTARFRSVFDEVLAALRATGRVPVIEVRTDRGTPAQQAARLRAALERVVA